jgi:amino-acid N-acetyltransferase
MNHVLDHTVPAARHAWNAVDARDAALTLRTARPDDGPGILALIMTHREEGHLLPRTLSDVTAHAARFVIAERHEAIVACAELAPLSDDLAEVRSLVVDGEERGSGLGHALVDELRRRGAAAGFHRLCAFTHAPAWFLHMGFSIVPHLWLSEKVLTDCVRCPLFRHCGQYAVIAALDEPPILQPPASSRVS